MTTDGEFLGNTSTPSQTDNHGVVGDGTVRRTMDDGILSGPLLPIQEILSTPSRPTKLYYHVYDQLVDLLGQDALGILLKELSAVLATTITSGIVPAEIHYSEQLKCNLLPIGYPYEVSIFNLGIADMIVYRAERPRRANDPDFLKPIFAIGTPQNRLLVILGNELPKLSLTESTIIARGVARQLPVPVLRRLAKLTTRR